jgi:hypothetical protein
LGDANVSRLLVVADSPVIQSYTAGQKAELVKLSRTVYNRVTQSLYETAGNYTRTTSPLFGIPRGMVYDTSLIMALFVVMLKRLDAYVYAEGIDTCELHLRALHQANNWVASLFREHIDFTVRVSDAAQDACSISTLSDDSQSLNRLRRTSTTGQEGRTSIRSMLISLSCELSRQQAVN